MATTPTTAAAQPTPATMHFERSRLDACSASHEYPGVSGSAVHVSASVRITTENRKGAGLTPQEELQLDVFCYGISYMYRKWIEGNYELSAEEAADLLYEMMPKSLSGYWVAKTAT